MAEEVGKLLPIKETQIGFWVLNIPHTAKPDYDFERACIGMDRTDIETEILINWNASSGMRIYDGFDPDVHVSKTELHYYPGLPICMGFDFGLSPACLIGQLNPLGQFQIFPSLAPEEREYEGIYSFGEKVADHLLKNYGMPHGKTLKQLNTYCVGDPAGRAMTRHSAGGRTSRELFSCFQILNTGLTLSLGEDEEGLPVREHLPGWGWLLYGGEVSHDKRQEAVRARLRWMIRPKVPALIVDPREEFVQSCFMGQYRRKVFSDGTYDRNPMKDHASHIMNSLEYLLSRLKVTPSQPEEEFDEDKSARRPEPFRSQSSSYHRG